jgi:Tol biopolymer transport system component
VLRRECSWPTGTGSGSGVWPSPDSDSGVKGNANSSGPSLSVDGTRVAFLSTATTLDPSDTDGLRDVYVKDLGTGDMTLASTSDTGVKGNSINHGPTLSADGTKVTFFSQATNLDPTDTPTPTHRRGCRSEHH